MPELVAAPLAENLLATSVMAPVIDATATAGTGALFEGLSGPASEFGIPSLFSGATGALGGALGTVGSGLGSLAGTGLAGTAPEAAAQLSSALSSATPGANQIASGLSNTFAPTSQYSDFISQAIKGIPQAGPPVDIAGPMSSVDPASLENPASFETPQGNILKTIAANPVSPASPLGAYTAGAPAGTLAAGTADLVDGGVQPTLSDTIDAFKDKFGGIGDLASNILSSSKKWVEDNPKTAAAGAALAGYALGQRKNVGVPQPQPYSGPLSKFHYDPAYYTPTAPTQPTPYRPVYQDYRTYADGGSIMDSGIPGTQLQGSNDPLMFQSTGVERMADGGIASLGHYSDGGQMLKGPGDGMSDSIPATIENKQPARLANNEFVIPADVVSHLGNGSSDAGAQQLYKMLDRVRMARTGRKSQGTQINPGKYLPA